MKRRDFMKGTAAAGAGAALAGPGLALADRDRPNVLLILVDQLRQPKWTPTLFTPNIDRISTNGVSFSNHFVAASPCSPSRACLMTGTYTKQNGMLTNCDFVEGNLQPSLDPRIPTLGHVFGNAGYSTPYRGKWHLTRRSDRNKKDDLIEYGFEGWGPPEAYFGGPPYCGAAFDPVYTRRACRWLRNEENHKRPWFMVASLVNPHDICAFPRYYPQRMFREIKTDEPPPNWTDNLEGKPGVQREYQEKYKSVGGPMDLADADMWRRYLDYYVHCIEDVDANVGRILDALEASGQADNTIVVFTSDHGEMAGSHRLRTKGNFMYEEVMNVPLIFSWPGRIPRGMVAGALASNVDVMPTLAGLAGVEGAPYMPGVDLSAVLEDPTLDSGREEVMCYNDWESVFTVGKETTDTQLYDNPSHVRCIRDGRWKYSHYFKTDSGEEDFELYNLSDDPLEMDNLALDQGYKSRRKEMHERLMEKEMKLVDEFEIG